MSGFGSASPSSKNEFMYDDASTISGLSSVHSVWSSLITSAPFDQAKGSLPRKLFHPPDGSEIPNSAPVLSW